MDTLVNDIKQDVLSPDSMYRYMRQRIPALNHSIDEWLKLIMKHHFSPQSGSRLWTRYKSEITFDPLNDVNTLEDLKLFGFFDKEILRKSRISDLIPTALADKPRRIFETGGTTGEPCRVIDITTGFDNLMMYHTMMESRQLNGNDILAMTPSGPHAYGTFVSRLAEHWNSNAYFIDFDPRWVKHLIKEKGDEKDYLDHLVTQATILLQRQNPGIIFSTSRLITQLSIRLPKLLKDYGVKAVCTGGTSLSLEEARYLKEGFLQDIVWIDTYGNTLMGHALQADAVVNHPGGYYLPPPLGIIEVVDPDNPEKRVDYGQRGRVKVSLLAKDMFIPNLLERDSAIRMEPHPWFPWDGVRDIRVFTDDQNDVIEGVY